LLTDDCGQPAGILTKTERHVVHLCVAFRECGADFAPVLVEDCNLKAECAPGTIVESFRLLVRDELPMRDSDSEVCNALLGAASAYEVVATVETGGKPVAVAVAHDGRRALVVNETGPALHVVDVETGAVTPVQGATLVSPIGGVSVAPDGGLVIVTHAKGIVTVDLASDPPKIAATIPSINPYGACAAVAGGKVLYAINPGTKEVDCIDMLASTSAPSVIKKIPVGGGPADLAVSADGKWLYVADLVAKKLVRVDCTSNLVITGSSKTISDKSRTLAVLGGTGSSEAFLASENTVHRVAEDGTESKVTIAGDPRDSALTTSGGRFYVVNRAGTAHELVVFATAGMTEIARVEVGAEPTSVAVVPDSRRALITNAGSGTISIIDVVPQKHLCEKLSAPCPQPAGCSCVTLATIELLPDGQIGVVDSCSYRRVIYSNAMLLEFILCLAERLDECCGTVVVPHVPNPPEPPPPVPEAFRIVAIDFLDENGGVVGPLQDLGTPTQFLLDQRVSAIRVTFNRPVDPATVTAAQGPSDVEMKKASFLVRRGGRRSFVPGKIESDGPNAVRFVVLEPSTFPPGDYAASLFGDSDATEGRPAITEQTSATRLDGEAGTTPTGLPSGNGTEGGTFKFKFIITG
jgi:DNA-binding beta-propeller fold protein YncE